MLGSVRFCHEMFSNKGGCMKKFLYFLLILFGIPILIFMLSSFIFIISGEDQSILLNDPESALVVFSLSSFFTGIIFYKPIIKLSMIQRLLFLLFSLSFLVTSLAVSSTSILTSIFTSITVFTPLLLGFLIRFFTHKKICSDKILYSFIVLIVFSPLLIYVIKGNSENALINAVKIEDSKLVELLLDKGNDPNVTDEALATPFMWASLKGNVSLMKLLKQKGADCKKNGVISLDNFERIYNSPINAAAGEGHLGAVTFMVEECGVNVNEDVYDYNHFYIKNKDVYDAYGAYDFLKATKDKKFSTIKLIENTKNTELLRGNISYEINKLLIKTNLSGVRPVSIGKENKFLQAIENRKILDRILYNYIVPNRSGYEIFSKFQFGCTPIVEAAGKRHANIVEYLISKGAEVDKTADGITALIYSVAKNNFGVAKILIKNGADIKAFDNDLKQTAFLSLSAKQELTFKENEKEILELVSLMIKKGADVNHKNIYGYTPLAFACKLKNEKLVKILVNNKADSDIKVNGEKIRDICKRNGIEISE